jgi:hypothetical protein
MISHCIFFLSPFKGLILIFLLTVQIDQVYSQIMIESYFVLYIVPLVFTVYFLQGQCFYKDQLDTNADTLCGL